MEKHIISKERVTNHGEVFTRKREVNAMLDLVKQETERIESRFLEPACGTGNFLVEILKRKLSIVKNRYAKNQLEFERYAVLAVSSIYGIDILQDNVQECRKRLFGIFDWKYTELFPKTTKNECISSVKFILEKNIIWGDAIEMKTEGENPQPIVFSEWSLFNNMIKRRDFSMKAMINSYMPEQMELFPEPDLFADFNEEEFIPEPINEPSLVHFLKLGELDEN
ncbi:MAG: hypothetical protein Q7J16_13235 [Candidatus Cloacimonadales bacterium]|nr:hypothetical protein [Candidatus Cloacimonadales bacterium]